MTKRKAKFGSFDISLAGEELKSGDKAPNFKALTKDLEDYDFYKEMHGVTIISVIPSLDTSICELQTYMLNKASQEDKLNIISISNDLPFAEQRFVREKGSENIVFLSDYLHNDFAKSYGVLIEEYNLLNRAIFVIDENKIIRHLEYLDQNTNLPDITKAVEVAKNL